MTNRNNPQSPKLCLCDCVWVPVCSSSPTPLSELLLSLRPSAGATAAWRSTALARGKAATPLNSWSRCLGREDGTPSPASPSSSTAVACTRSWSRTAARWRNTLRRTGETTVRISTATKPASRNWVRNPILAHLPPWVSPVLLAVWHTHTSVPAVTSRMECGRDVKHIPGEKRDRNSSINQKQTMDQDWKKEELFAQKQQRWYHPCLPFHSQFYFPSWDSGDTFLSSGTWALPFRHHLLKLWTGLQPAAGSTNNCKKMLLFLIYLDILILNMSIFISRGVAFFKWKNSKQAHTWCFRPKPNSSTCFSCLN